jgi:hypothetical protein
MTFLKTIIRAAVIILVMASPAAAITSLGDYPTGATVYCHWDTNSGVGASITRSTNGTVAVYKSADLTQTTTGVTDAEDQDFTGNHIASIVTTDSFYATGTDFFVKVSAMTVDGQTVNATLCHFSIERIQRAPVIVTGTAVVKDGVSVILTIPLVKTSGKPYTGLLFNSTGMVAEYCRANAASTCTSITLTGTCSLGTFTSGCLLEKDTTAGLYQIHVPDAAFATGTDRGTITVSGVAGMVPTIIPYELVNVGLAAISTTLGTPVSSIAADIAAITGTSIPELTQAAPSATPTIYQAIMALYMAFRNQTLTTSGQISYSNDAGTVLFKCTLADNGTTFTKSECVTGP